MWLLFIEIVAGIIAAIRGWGATPILLLVGSFIFGLVMGPIVGANGLGCLSIIDWVITISLVVMAIVGKKKEPVYPPVPQVRPAPENRIRCPNCAELIHPQAKVCRYCGYSLTGSPKRLVSPDPAPPAIDETKIEAVKDTKNDLFEEAKEFYLLLGNTISGEIYRNEQVCDLLILSKNGEKWVARCQLGDVFDMQSARDFIAVLKHELPKEAAIITTGKFSPDVVDLVKGKPIHLMDMLTFDGYLTKARDLAKKKSLIIDA